MEHLEEEGKQMWFLLLLEGPKILDQAVKIDAILKKTSQILD